MVTHEPKISSCNREVASLYWSAIFLAVVDKLTFFWYRMTFKMYAVDFCELVLFDEQKQALHLMMHSFDKEVAMDALVG